MRVSNAALNLIKRFEGFRSHTYLDIAGIPTIGYGHRLLSGENFPNGLDEAAAETLLERDVQAAEAAVGRLVKSPLTQGQFDALVDFVYNLGEGSLAGSTLLRHLNAEEYQAAVEQFVLWDHSGKKEVASLKERRMAETALWREPPAAPLAAA